MPLNESVQIGNSHFDSNTAHVLSIDIISELTTHKMPATGNRLFTIFVCWCVFQMSTYINYRHDVRILNRNCLQGMNSIYIQAWKTPTPAAVILSRYITIAYDGQRYRAEQILCCCHPHNTHIRHTYIYIYIHIQPDTCSLLMLTQP